MLNINNNQVLFKVKNMRLFTIYHCKYVRPGKGNFNSFLAVNFSE